MTGRQITERIISVGAVDWDRRLFDELIETPDGTSYNSYLIKGSEKTALIDTVDFHKKEELLSHLQDVSRIDYVISNHAEQDHSGNIPTILEQYPNATVVCNKLCKGMLIDEHGIQENRFIVIEDKEELSLGDLTLKFIFTPWVHWPETMCTYVKEEKVLLTCDFFGAHIATSDLYVKNPIELIPHMKRYYSEIMMPFANIIKKNIEKVRELDIKLICPAHGPIHQDPEFPLKIYEEWTSNKVKPKVVVIYTSNHGSTRQMVEYACEKLATRHLEVRVFNLTNSSFASIAMEMVDASMLLVASPTFLGGFHPNVAQALFVLNALRPKAKIIGYLGSNEWGGHVVSDLHNATKGFTKAKVIEPLIIKGKADKANFHDIDKYVDTIVNEHENLESVLLNTLPKKQSLFQPPRTVSLVIGGAAGQGLQSLQLLLTELLKHEGFYVFSTTEYESRIRGGSNTVEIRVSDRPVEGFVDAIDIFLPLNKDAVEHAKHRISEKTIILGDKKTIGDHEQIKDISFVSMAQEIGHKVYANTIAVGVILGLFTTDKHYAKHLLTEKFSRKGDDVVENNHQALHKGYSIGENLQQEFSHLTTIGRDASVKGTFFMTGAQSIAWGALAGGCNFISAYPMSPSTGVLNELQKQHEDFGVIVLQAEDEIAAMNMTLGSWYAGGRALANTSGGGFALMTEAVSLAGMIESPLVCHIAQRPGPATGLPTRTAQEDLNLALYAGHGEFARVIFAPSTVEEGFLLTKKAFELADLLQVPVFILTDQYFMDTLVNINAPELSGKAPTQHIVRSTANYKRYELTESGISNRAVPGYGEGLVCVDSDEHDEDGHITERMDVRESMVQKRMKRFDILQEHILPPKRYGKATASTIIIGWGTTYGSIREALEISERDDIAYLHFTQVFPLPKKIDEWLGFAKQIIVLENNATGQFAQLLQQHTTTPIKKILKYDGMPFSVEEIRKKIQEVISP